MKPKTLAQIQAATGTIVPVGTLSNAVGMPNQGDIDADAVFRAFHLLGRVQGHGRWTTMGWGFDVDCPWADEHSDRTHEGAVYVPVHGRFQCHHGHCEDRTVADVRPKLDELLREDSGGAVTLAALEFGAVANPKLAGGLATGRPGGRALASYEATEDGLALAFADAHAGKLRCDHLRQKWFEWVGWYWRRDEVARAFAWARRLTREFRASQETELKALAKIAVAGAIERAARSDDRLAVSGRDWDQDPWRAGAPGAELDLAMGELVPADPRHGITRQLAVGPVRMPTPVWDQFLWEVTGGDPATIRFLQAWLGYCLTGDTGEEKFLFLYGPGGNGKTTFVRVMSEILGDYAVHAADDLFMVRKHGEHKTEIAALEGARAVFPAEFGDGQTFNLGRLKDFTGSGTLAARGMRQDMFNFVPRFKLTFVGNDRPKLGNVDDAIRRRLVLVPFTFKPTVVDTTLKARLVHEYPGILAWAIKGEMLRGMTPGGLAGLVPAAAVAATNEYLDGEDLFKSWAEDRCEFGPAFQLGIGEGHEAYRTWCFSRGEQPTVSSRQFRLKFLSSYPGCTEGRLAATRFVVGAKLAGKDDDDDDPPC